MNTFDFAQTSICVCIYSINNFFFNVNVSSAGGFLHSSIVDEHLVDHYIPFLPLELKHVRQCVLVEMAHLNITQDSDLADEVAGNMPYFPKEEKIFSLKGCKTVRQKLALHIDLQQLKLSS